MGSVGLYIWYYRPTCLVLYNGEEKTVGHCLPVYILHLFMVSRYLLKVFTLLSWSAFLDGHKNKIRLHIIEQWWKRGTIISPRNTQRWRSADKLITYLAGSNPVCSTNIKLKSTYSNQKHRLVI